MLKAVNHSINDEKFNKENNLYWKEPFYFVQAADSQLGLITRYPFVEKATEEGKEGWIDGPINDWSKEKELCVETVRLVNQLEPKPKFMIICGDMLDQFPFKVDYNYTDGRMTNDLDPVRQRQYNDFIEIFSKIKIPLLCICGNHDVGDKMTLKSVERYRSEFGDEYFKFYFDGTLFIALNSQLYFDPNECESLAVAQEKWLDKVLKEESKQFKHVIVLQHHPLFRQAIDEPDSFLNLPTEKRKALIDKFRSFGVRKVFAGHSHRNSIGKYENLECIVTSAIGLQTDKSDNHGFRVVKVEENEIKHQYYALKDKPKKVNL